MSLTCYHTLKTSSPTPPHPSIGFLSKRQPHGFCEHGGFIQSQPLITRAPQMWTAGNRGNEREDGWKGRWMQSPLHAWLGSRHFSSTTSFCCTVSCDLDLTDEDKSSRTWSLLSYGAGSLVGLRKRRTNNQACDLMTLNLTHFMRNIPVPSFCAWETLKPNNTLTDSYTWSRWGQRPQHQTQKATLAWSLF
jgi:hypothetical protein